MPDLKLIQATLKELKTELSKRYGVSSLGLFGSVVRNDFTDDSDIDILVPLISL